ncbi:type I-E CRISPR-associated protein Cse2/CasB [Roseovarius sp. ZX-A-9]|uniref:type I-E CRISPR-associated protein Cse2/CasB n=1 Tax=Roseovarius sp. ZX-A-9 TaxID=3014783 RepID=UPI00232F81B9|nr:type I-E CRISPR-associated protein Cse2/CasB [Roseovarius sp. ZX-A-9]
MAPDDPQDVVAKRALAIASAIAAADPGERAAARRMGQGGCPLFWRQAARLGIAPHEEARWMRFTLMIALLTPSTATESIHKAKRPLGAVLADGGDAGGKLDKPVVSEQRLARLLAARGISRLDTLERTVRMVARTKPPLDVVDLAWVVLREDSGSLAREYYRRLDRQTDTDKKEPENA